LFTASSTGAAGCSGAFAQPKTSRAHMIIDIMTVSFLIKLSNFLSYCADIIIIIEIPDFVSGAASDFTDCTYFRALEKVNKGRGHCVFFV